MVGSERADVKFQRWPSICCTKYKTRFLQEKSKGGDKIGGGEEKSETNASETAGNIEGKEDLGKQRKRLIRNYKSTMKRK
jgi:hypothetical protein